MKKFGLIGYPIAGSQSPRLFAEFTGGKYTYDLIEEPSFEKAWKRFIDGYDGVNVTAPYKVEACERATTLSPECEIIGAANLLLKKGPKSVAAYNTDYSAVSLIILDILKEFPAARTCAVVGAGGAAKAALVAALEMGLKCSMYNRTVSRASEFAESLSSFFGPKRKVAVFPLEGEIEADIVIYAIPAALPDGVSVKASCLLEANYVSPSMEVGPYKYIAGISWLERQAAAGYPLFLAE
ncbi:MAG: hypothetical protein MJY56_00975 [Bacteroidales bacterium]|nr:hypothetical protein [Bacteroidales bacterium]